jgi:hypothetical protein
MHGAYNAKLADIFHASRILTPESPNLRLSYVTHMYLAPYSKHCRSLYYKFRATLSGNVVHLFTHRSFTLKEGRRLIAAGYCEP